MTMLHLKRKRPVSETIRAVVQMYNDGLTHQQIANNLEISPAYVNKILVQVRKGEVSMQ